MPTFPEASLRAHPVGYFRQAFRAKAVEATEPRNQVHPYPSLPLARPCQPSIPRYILSIPKNSKLKTQNSTSPFSPFQAHPTYPHDVTFREGDRAVHLGVVEVCAVCGGDILQPGTPISPANQRMLGRNEVIVQRYRVGRLPTE